MLSLFKLSQLLLLAGILASLSFGAKEAMAVKASIPCYDSPTMLGECASHEECNNRCRLAGGFQGTCENGCCVCAYFLS